MGYHITLAKFALFHSTRSLTAVRGEDNREVKKGNVIAHWAIYHRRKHTKPHATNLLHAIYSLSIWDKNVLCHRAVPVGDSPEGRLNCACGSVESIKLGLSAGRG